MRKSRTPIMRKWCIIILAILFVFSASANAQQYVFDEPDLDGIQYQLYIYGQLTQYLDDLFRKFSDGYMQPDEALKKVTLLGHEYNKLVEPVPKEAEKLHGLTNILLSRIENYFINWKRSNREDPEINVKIAETKFELLQESERLKYLYS